MGDPFHAEQYAEENAVDLAKLTIDAHNIRRRPIKPELQQALRAAVTAVYGPDYRVSVISAAQRPGPKGTPGTTGTRRHGTGAAADVYIYAPDGHKLVTNELLPLTQHWLATKTGSVGFPTDAAHSLHLDLIGGKGAGAVPLGKGEGLTWYYPKGAVPTKSQSAAISAGLSGTAPKYTVSPEAVAKGLVPPASIPAGAPIPVTRSAQAAIEAAVPRASVSSAAAGYTPAVTVAPTLQAAAETAAARMRIARAPVIPSLEARDETAARRPQVVTVAPSMASAAAAPATARAVIAPPLPPPPRSPIFDALGLPNPGVTVVDGMQHNARDLAQRQATQAELDARGADIIGAGPTATGVMRQAGEPESPFGAFDIFRAMGLRNPGETVADAVYDRSLPTPDVTPRPASGTPRGKESPGGVTAPASIFPAVGASQAAAAPAGSFRGDLLAFLEERARAQVAVKPASAATTKAAPARAPASAIDPVGTAPTTYGVNTALHPERVASAKDQLLSILSGSIKPDANRIDVVSKRGSDPVGTAPTAKGVSKVAAAKDELEQLLKPNATPAGTMARPAVAKPAVAMTAPGATRAAPATASPVKAAATMTAAVIARPAVMMKAPAAVQYPTSVETDANGKVVGAVVFPRPVIAPQPSPVIQPITPRRMTLSGQEVAPRGTIPAGYQPAQHPDMTLNIPDVGAASRAKVKATIPQKQAEKDWANTGFDKPVVAPPRIVTQPSAPTSTDAAAAALAAGHPDPRYPTAPDQFWTNPKGEKYRVGDVLTGNGGTTQYRVTAKGLEKMSDTRPLGGADGNNIVRGAINNGIKSMAEANGWEYTTVPIKDPVELPRAVVAPVPVVRSAGLQSAPKMTPGVGKPAVTMKAEAAATPAEVPFTAWPATSVPIGYGPDGQPLAAKASWWGSALTPPKPATAAKPKSTATTRVAVTTAPPRVAVAPNPAVQSGSLSMRRATTAPGTGTSYTNPGGTGLGVLLAKAIAAATGIDVSNGFMGPPGIPSNGSTPSYGNSPQSRSSDGEHFYSGATPGAYYDDQSGWQVQGARPYNSGGSSGLSSGH